MTIAADRIRIVLVDTSHPGNIGAAARAIKTMNLAHLVLVSPKLYPHSDATARAAGADDILHHCEVVDSLAEAIADCQLVIGTSARMRTLAWPQLTPRECGEKVASDAINSEIAIVFGREKSGLSNEELQLCHYHVHIPCNPDYQSLNLAAAVQVLTYEINVALLNLYGESSCDVESAPADPKATSADMMHFYQHLTHALTVADFLENKQTEQLMRRLHRLFNRAQLSKQEVQILSGIFKAISHKLS